MGHPCGTSVSLANLGKYAMSEKESLEQLIKQLPAQIKLIEFISPDSGKIKFSEPYDLIIFGYRNTVTYTRLRYSGKTLGLSQALIEFFDGRLIDNVKRMIEYLKEIQFQEIKR